MEAKLKDGESVVKPLGLLNGLWDTSFCGVTVACCTGSAGTKGADSPGMKRTVFGFMAVGPSFLLEICGYYASDFGTFKMLLSFYASSRLFLGLIFDGIFVTTLTSVYVNMVP